MEADKPIIAKNPFDEPGKPGRPAATDWDKDFVDLEWQAPQSDGMLESVDFMTLGVYILYIDYIL